MEKVKLFKESAMNIKRNRILMGRDFIETERFRRALIENLPDIIYRIFSREDNRIMFFNKINESMIGYKEDEIRGGSVSPIETFIHPLDRPKVRSKIRRAVENRKAFSVDYRFMHKDGSIRYFHEKGRPVMGDDGKLLYIDGVIGDITELKKSEESLRSMSFIDDLTGIHNRRGFLELANQQLKIANRDRVGLLLLFADLDNMKWINDTLGHLAGDRALKDTAGFFRETFRESDIIARIGGDEFVVLAVETPEVKIVSIAARLTSALDAYNEKNDRTFRLSLSFGIVRYDPEHPCSIEELLSIADTLMYENKKAKKNRI